MPIPPWIKKPQQGDREISSRMLRDLMEQANIANKITVEAPLSMSKTNGGVAIGIQIPAVSNGILAKAKKSSGSPQSLKDWTDPGGTKTIAWDFELPATYSFNTTTGAISWTGSGTYVKVRNITDHFIPENQYCFLFQAGLPTPLNYWCYHHMPFMISGLLNADLTPGGSVTIGSGSSECYVTDNLLETAYKLRDNTRVHACLSGQTYYVTNATSCPEAY